jgi:hypothetical protein
LGQQHRAIPEKCNAQSIFIDHDRGARLVDVAACAYGWDAEILERLPGILCRFGPEIANVIGRD